MIIFPISNYIVTNPKDYNIVQCRTDLAKGAERTFNEYKLYCQEKEAYSFLDVPYNENYRLIILGERIIKSGSRPQFSFIGVLIGKEYYQNRIDVLDLCEKIKTLDIDRFLFPKEVKNISLEIRNIAVVDSLQSFVDLKELSKFSIKADSVVKEVRNFLTTFYSYPFDKWFNKYSYSINPDDSVGSYPTDIVLTSKPKFIEQASVEPVPVKSNSRIAVIALCLFITLTSYFVLHHVSCNNKEDIVDNTNKYKTIETKDISLFEIEANEQNKNNASDVVTLNEFRINSDLEANVTDLNTGINTNQDAPKEQITDRIESLNNIDGR